MKLHDLFEHLYDLYEIMNTKIPVTDWVTTNAGTSGSMVLDGHTYTINLYPYVKSIDGQNFTYINCTFQIIKPDGTADEALQMTSHNGSKVIGAIAHAIKDKLNDTQYDAVTMVAVDNIKRRLSVYAQVAIRIVGGGWNSFTIDLMDGGKAVILFNPKSINKTVASKLVDELREKQ